MPRLKTRRANSKRRLQLLPRPFRPRFELLEDRRLLSVAPPGSEFLVNTYTTGSQLKPDVASDPAGNFVVVWASSQEGDQSGIYAQRFSVTGATQGDEFQVNTYTTDEQDTAAVAMDAAGDFVVVWESDGQDGDGFGLYAQRYDAAGVPQGAEFQVNSHTTGHQAVAAVAMDAAGNFVVAWQSDGQDGSGLGVYAQRYDATGVAQGAEFQVNTYTTGGQSSPAVAMDAAGNFVITWTSGGQDGDGSGIYAQRYDAGGATQGGEFRVNSFTTADQYNNAVAMDDWGNFAVAWESNAQDGSGSGVYAQRYDSSGVAQGGEFRVNVYTTNSQSGPAVAADALGNFVFAWESDGQDGDDGGIYARRYDQGSEFRVNSYTTSGQYRPAVAMDDAGNFVATWQSTGQDGSGWGVYARMSARPPGPEFRVNTFTTSNQRGPAVASDAEGNAVVVWTSLHFSHQGIFAQRLDAAGVAQGPEFQVNSYTTSTQEEPTVAMDAAGNFVVVWESDGQDGDGDGIYAQRYDTAGVAQGGEFGVNSYTTGNQNAPSVAMDADGDFVVTWNSDGQDGGNGGIYSQRFDADGTALGGEFRVNTYTTTDQFLPSVGMDAGGNFVVAWTSLDQDGSGYGVYAQRYDAAGVALGGEFRVNTYTTGNQYLPSVAIDAAGNFVIAWTGRGDVVPIEGIHAKRYNAAGVAQGTDFRVNTYTSSAQYAPSVAIDAAGNFVVVWQSWQQDNDDWGIFGQRYNAAGVAYGDEFPLNNFTLFGQTSPAVAMDAGGNIVATWQSGQQDGDGDGIYALFSPRPLADPGGPYTVAEGSPLVLDGSSSAPAAFSSIVSYQWDLDYDGVTFDVDAVGAAAPFDAPEGPLVKTAALRVTDDAERVHIATTTVTVNNAPPQIVSLPDASGLPGQPVGFSALAIDPSASDVVTYEWDFGDSATQSGVDLTNPTHTYATQGEFDAMLTVRDQQGGESSQGFRVVVGPAVEFFFASQPAIENVGYVTVDAWFDGVAAQDIEIPLIFTGTATEGADYTVSSATLTIPAGTSAGQITVTIGDDVLDEATETVIVTMGVPLTQASLGDIVTHTISIDDNDPLPQVALTSSSTFVDEDAGTVLVGVRLLQVSGRDVTVPLIFAGTASAFVDYTPTGSIVIPAGQTTASIAVPIYNDAIPEGAELVFVNLQPSSTVELSTVPGDPVHHTIIIRQNDEPSVRLTSAYRAVIEDAGSIQLTVALSTASTLGITVPYTLGGTATPGTDYTVNPAGSIFIPAGQTQTVMTVSLAADGLEEEDETFEITLGTPTNATLGSTTSFLAEIGDADSRQVSFVVDSQEVYENVGTVAVEVSLSKLAGTDVVVPVRILTTNALEASEYQVSADDIIIPAGSLVVTRIIQIVDDLLTENSREALRIELQPPANLKLGDHKSFTLDVLDDDPEVEFKGFRGGFYPSATITNSRTVPESAGNLAITVSLSSPTNVAVQVPFVFAGAAEAGVDFGVSPASVLVIPAGENSGVIDLSIVDDLFPEGKASNWGFGSQRGESFSIKLGTPVNATRGARDELTVTITDNDVQPKLNLTTSEQSVSEGSKKARIDAELTVAIAVPVTLELILNGGSATLNNDFKIGASTIVIPAGSLTGSVDITILDDKTFEADETIILKTGQVTNAAIEANWTGSASRTHTITITDNDKKPAEVATSNIQVGSLRIDPNPPKSKLKIPKFNDFDSGGTVNVGTLVLSLSDGYLQGSRAFFDANFNGTRDFLDLDDDGIQDEDEPSEPEALTEFDGMAAVEIDPAFDRDSNGILDLTEGQWVGVAGEDTSTQLPSNVKFVAPISVYVLSPVSTVLAALVREHGFDLAEAEQRVWEAFDLPLVDLRTLNVLEEAADGDGDAAALFAVNARIQDTVVPIAKLLTGIPGAPPLVTLADLTFADIAAKIAAPDSALNLANASVVANVIRGVLSSIGLSLPTATVDGAAQMIAEANQRIAELPNTADVDFVEQVARVQTVAQGTIADQLADVAAGTLAISTAIANNTGAALDSQIAAAAIGNVATPLLAVSDVEEIEGNGGSRTFAFTVSLVGTSRLPVSVEYATLDSTATSADGDYTPTSGTLSWAAGDNTPRTILVEVFGDTAFEPDEAFLVVLNNPLNAAIRWQIAYGFLLNDEPLTFNAPAYTDSNAMHLRLDGQSATLSLNEEIVFSGTFFNPQPITIVGAANLENALVVEVASASNLLGGGLTFQGGTLDDFLLVIDETAGVTVHSRNLADAGSYDVDGALVTYTGVEETGDLLTAAITGLPTSPLVGTLVSLGSELPLEDEGVTIEYAWEVTRGGSLVASGTAATLDFTPDQPGDYVVSLAITAAGRGTGTELVTLSVNDAFSSTVTGRRLFYNNSIWDNEGYGYTNASAIATDKVAYIPSGGGATTSTFANMSSYTGGINGIMVELAGTHGALTADDFTIRMSGQFNAMNNSPGTWAAAPSFTVTLVPDTPVSGTDRYELIWPDGAIVNRYVYVLVEGNDTEGGNNTNTGLATSDYFFYGNMIGDTGQDAYPYPYVNATDQLQTRANSGDTDILSPFDFNRDAEVNAIDTLTVRNNLGNFMPYLIIATAGPYAPEGPGGGDGDDASASWLAFALAASSGESAWARATTLLFERLAEVAQGASRAAVAPPALVESGPLSPGRLDGADSAAVDLALDDELLDSLLA
jgi:hypothetical protein